MRALQVAFLATCVTAPACAGDPPAHLDATTPTDAAVGEPDVPPDLGPRGASTTADACSPTTITEAQASRRSSAASVTVDAVLLNAVSGCLGDEIRFKLVLDTHSVPLLAFNLAALARLEASSGATVSGGVRWVGTSESDHHREGVLSAPAPRLSGAEWLRLVVREVAGVDRAFEWDMPFLGWTRQP